MKKTLLGLYVCVWMTILAGPAVAQDAGPVLEKGQTLVTLSAGDQKDVDQDELVASLRIELEDKDPRKLQDRINKAMKAAVDLAKKEKEVEVTTGQYYVYSQDVTPRVKILSTETEREIVWKGSQELGLKSRDSRKVLDLLAGIQSEGFVMNGLSYMLSAELAEAQKDMLLQGALEKIQDKAALIAKSLGKSGYDMIEVNVDGSYMPSPVPMLRGAMKMEMATMASDVGSAPVAEPGETTVSVSVSARVILKP